MYSSAYLHADTLLSLFYSSGLSQLLPCIACSTAVPWLKARPSSGIQIQLLQLVGGIQNSPDGISALYIERVCIIGGQELRQVTGNQCPCILISPQPEEEARMQINAGLPRCLPLLRDICVLPRLMDDRGDQRRAHGAGIARSVCDWIITCKANAPLRKTLPAPGY